MPARNDELGGIAERGVEEAADRVADTGGQLLGGEAQQTSQRDDRDAGEHEAKQGRVWPRMMDPDRDGYREQQPSQWRLGQHVSQNLHRNLPRLEP